MDTSLAMYNVSLIIRISANTSIQHYQHIELCIILNYTKYIYTYTKYLHKYAHIIINTSDIIP